MRADGRISRAVGLLVFCTLLCKALALVRDMLIAWQYGASVATDAFYAALTFPAILVPTIGELPNVTAVIVGLLAVASWISIHALPAAWRLGGVVAPAIAP